MANAKITIISDIHMSNNASYAWFQDKQAALLIGMLDSAANNTKLDELLLLGDAFDLWVYPIDVAPWTFEEVVNQWRRPAKGTTQSVIGALKRCIEKVPNVYYINGNHDMQVTASQVESIASGGNRIHWTTPQAYRQKYGGRLHVEHGHGVDMFNAPDNSTDTLNGMPLGYYITRLVASAADPDTKQTKLNGMLLGFQKKYLTGAKQRDGDDQKLGEILVNAIIDLLTADLLIHGKLVTDDTEIVFADPSRNVTIGQVKDAYHSLLGTWHTGGWDQLLDNMLVCAIPNGLDWYAKNLLEGQNPPQAVVFGHTHHSEQNIYGARKYGNDGCWCNSPKNSRPSCIALDVTPSAIDVTLVNWIVSG
ncbi:MAG: metallophosphoesterase [Pseudomonadota bacterium]